MPDTLDQPKNDFWVFREGKKNVSTSSLVDRLVSSLLPGAPCAQSQVISALLCAGELECGLADANSPAVSSAEKITDILASAMLGACQTLAELPGLFAELQHMALPEQLLISPAEGFAYYALHPLDFAQLALRSAVNTCCAVIGIRSIGTTLSAITAAAFRSQSYATARITVRPTGHPYQRETAFTKEQTKWVEKHRDCGAFFFVTDEGPEEVAHRSCPWETP